MFDNSLNVVNSMVKDRNVLHMHFDKITRCIASCETTQQLDCCKRMVHTFNKKNRYIKNSWIRFAAKYIEFHGIFDEYKIALDQNMLYKMIHDKNLLLIGNGYKECTIQYERSIDN
jgi:hypothetical protein